MTESEKGANFIRVTGETVDGAPVLSGIGTLSTTYGLSLEAALRWLKDRGLVLDWIDYITTCLKDGHRPQTIKSRMLAAVGDVYGATSLRGLAPRLDAASVRVA